MSTDQITPTDVAAHTWLPSPPLADLLPILHAADLVVRRSVAPDGTPLVEVAHRDCPDKPLISVDLTDALTLVAEVAREVGAVHARPEVVS